VIADHSGVFLVARRRKAFGFEDAFLWKFDHAGVLRWRTHLASGSTGGFGYRRATLAVPTLIDGAVLVQTNLGAIASVNAYTGQINWISTYDTARQEQRNRWQSTAAHEIQPWQYYPMYPLPDRQLVALPLEVAELHNVRSVLGVVDGQVYAQGDALFSWDPNSDTTAWSQPLPESPIYGRAALSMSHIYLPCQSGLYTYPLRGGAPKAKPWDHTHEGGNIVVLPESILVAGNSRITSYGLRENVFARLQARMDENPRDPWAALNMAEVAYRTAFSQPAASSKTSDYRRAEDALAEAIRRAGGFAAAWDAPFKIRIFRDLLEFADLHMREEPANLDAAVDMLIKAGLCPPDALSLLKQKSKLAAARSHQGDFANEIREYHHILSDRALRVLPWPGTEADPTSAGEVCDAKIAELIRQHGREIYEPLDKKASSLLTLATKDGDLKRLDHIIEVLPNSRAAPKALIEKGAILRDRNNQPRQAMRSYYAALTRYPKLVDSADVIKEIALCHVAADQPAAAWEWLTKGCREFPNNRITVQGRSMAFRDLRATLGSVDRLPRASLPVMGMHLREGFTLPVDGKEHLLYPEFAAQRNSDWSRMFLYRDGALHALDPVSGQAHWDEPCLFEQRPRLLAALRDVILLTTRFEILGMHPDSGKILWRHGDAGSGFDDPAADPEDFPYWRLHRMGVELPLGRVVWEQDLAHRPSQAMNVEDHLTVYRAVTEEQQVLVVLSTSDGRVQRTIPLLEERPILHIVPTQAGFIILITSQSMIALDPLSGVIEWRKTFDHNFLVDSVHTVLDGILVSPDSLRVVKLSLDTGRELWRSSPFGARQSDLRLLPVQDELYVANDRRVYSIDPATGADLGSAHLPPGAHPAQLTLTDDRLALIGVDSDYWMVSSRRRAQLENLLERQPRQPLGAELGPTEFYFFDYAIIGVSEDAFRGWVSSSESND
jgi:outer membrane protein assembly factor BamB/tetratricopeptide (TPR) repeat protein